MAKSVKKVENKEANKKEVDKVDKSNHSEVTEVELLKAQIEEMKKAMNEMKSQSKLPSENILAGSTEKEILIGCRMLQGIGLSSDDGSIKISLDFNDIQPITIEEMKKLFRKSNIKKIFEDGICYFVEENSYYYNMFNIRNHKDLSDENLISILTQKDTNDIVRNLDMLTENKRNSNVLNCIIYRICDMIRKGLLKDWDYYIRKGIEDYFKIEFDRGISTLNALDKIKS